MAHNPPRARSSNQGVRRGGLAGVALVGLTYLLAFPVATAMAEGTVSISGEIRCGLFGFGIPDVVMTGLPGEPETDSDGRYTATVPSGWSGTVIPRFSGLHFDPPWRVYTNVTSNVEDDYETTLPFPTVAGYVRTAGGAAIPDVLMQGLPGTTKTNGTGYYMGIVSLGWSGTVTPQKTGYTFSPTSRAYSDVTGDETGDDYTGGVANQPPDAVDDAASVDANSWNNEIDVLANDTDGDGDTLTITSVTDPACGTAAIVGTHIEYTPDPDYPLPSATGQDTFQYTISDGRGGTDTATVTVNVNAPSITVTDCPSDVTGGQPVTVTWTISGGTPSAHNHLHWRKAGDTWQGSAYTTTPPYSSSLTAPGESCTVEVVVHAVISGRSYYSQVNQVTVTASTTITVTDCPTEVAAGDTVAVTWTISGGTPSAHNHLHWRKAGDAWQGSAYTTTPPYTSSFTAPGESCTVEVVVHAVVDGAGWYSDVHQVTVTAPPTITVTDCPTEVAAGGTVAVTWTISGGTPSAHNHLHWRKAGDAWQGSAYTTAPPYSSSFIAPGESCTIEAMVHAVIGGQSYYSEVSQVTVAAPTSVTVTDCPTAATGGETVTVTWTVSGGTPSAHNHLHWRKVGGTWQGSAYTTTPPYASSFTAPNESCTVEVMVHAVVEGRSYYSAVQQVGVSGPAAAAAPCLDVLSGQDIDFGSVAVGAVKVVEPALRIRNAGGGILEVTVTVEAPFHVLPPGGLPSAQHSLRLAAGEEAALGLDFAPFAQGAFAETVAIASNGGSFACTATGKGTAPSE